MCLPAKKQATKLEKFKSEVLKIHSGALFLWDEENIANLFFFSLTWEHLAKSSDNHKDQFPHESQKDKGCGLTLLDHLHFGRLLTCPRLQLKRENDPYFCVINCAFGIISLIFANDSFSRTVQEWSPEDSVVNGSFLLSCVMCHCACLLLPIHVYSVWVIPAFYIVMVEFSLLLVSQFNRNQFYNQRHSFFSENASKNVISVR